jgi:hypothetical protein
MIQHTIEKQTSFAILNIAALSFFSQALASGKSEQQ